MFLSGMRFTNFRCYEQVEFEPLERLAVFIGENDAGKTVLLEAVEIVVGKKSVGPHHFHKMPSGEASDTLTLYGAFNLDENDTVPDVWRSNGTLHIRRTFRNEASVLNEVEVLGRGYSDDRFDGFAGMRADDQKAVLNQYDVSPATNAPGRLDQREQLVNEGRVQHVERWVKMQPSEVATLNSHLPLIERIASTEYRHPEQVIQRRLQVVASQVISPVDPATGKPREIEVLAGVRAQIAEALNQEIQSIVPALQRVHHKLKGVVGHPNVDFAKAVTTPSIVLDCGEGEQGFETFGEGTKKRIWMGLLEWESKGSGDVRNVIRLYDEPDVNLHYQAQRQLFQNIVELVDDADSRTQCLVCTHSLQLIDRAPITAVNLIRVADDGKRETCRIQGLEDSDYTDFYKDVGHAVGLTNTALLYERAFLVVEGESEERAVPIIYENLFGRDIRDDGIRVVDLSTCGAWKSVLKILLKNRMAIIHLLLDKDCDSPTSSAYVKPSVLEKLGCGPEFLDQQVTYIGEKEFEDAFATDILHRAVQAAFQFGEGQEWGVDEIDRMKAESDKFSESLKQRIYHSCIPSQRPNAKKHYIADAVAKQCTCEADVPPALLEALWRVRELAGISERSE